MCSVVAIDESEVRSFYIFFNYFVQAKNGLLAGAAGAGFAVAGKAAVGAMVPTIMSMTGTVVAGTGTVFATGGAAATAQAVAAASLGPVAIVGGTVGFGGYYMYKTYTAEPSGEE